MVSTLGNMSGAYAFSKDIFLMIPLIADWETTSQCCEHFVNGNLHHANHKQSQCNNALGHEAFENVHNPTKITQLSWKKELFAIIPLNKPM
jgi:hypothetical protein